MVLRIYVAHIVTLQAAGIYTVSYCYLSAITVCNIRKILWTLKLHDAVLYMANLWKFEISF